MINAGSAVWRTVVLAGSGIQAAHWSGERKKVTAIPTFLFLNTHKTHKHRGNQQDDSHWQINTEEEVPPW